MIAFLIAVLALAPQEPVESLVRELGDDSLETREAAERKLLQVGEPARAALEKAASTGDGELKVRVLKILKVLDFEKELKAWLAPPARISLSGELTLEEAVREVEKQSGQKVTCASWPEGKFRVDLKEAPYWEALDAVCALSGKRTLTVQDAGPALIGDRYVKIPGSASGSFCVRFDTFRETRRYSVAGSSENHTIALMLHLGWERSVAPVQTYVAWENVSDDTGRNYLAAMQEYESRSFSGGAWYVKDPAPTFRMPLHAAAFTVLPGWDGLRTGYRRVKCGLRQLKGC